MSKLYLADFIYTNEKFHQDFGLLEEHGKIAAMGPAAELIAQRPDAERIDCGGQAIVPGTVNGHNHSFQSLLRGIAADKPFLEWREQALYKYTPLMDEEAIYTGALFAFGEMIRYGVTTVSDFFYIHNGGTDCDEAVIQAARDAGIRLVLARTMYDWSGAPLAYRETVQEAVQRTRSLAIKYQGNAMTVVHPAPHSPHAASPEMIKAGYRLAAELDTPFHIHVAEEMFEVEEILRDYGKRPIHYLDSLGVLDERMIAIHLVWLDASEIELIGAKRGALAYCPSSNMFLADGVTRIPDLLKAGVNIMLGSDGACSNNRISVFEEMRMCALLQKVSRLDGTCITAGEVYRMGTANAGDILRLPIGKLAPGFAADLVMLDLQDLSLAPKAELFANMVYAMQPGAVSRVVVDGRTVFEQGRLANIPEKEIGRKVETLFDKWRKRQKNV